ncbi:TIGR00297 family protein [Salipaludibacillus aurantiacus]|uniref:TIGR00297 family protein n=2 Tax=Salipaludibacillus aurantiacus TaxID=1601833 RepID=A0A1H9R817_9BACI|nr:TIGR00297 family protein [Salipaludibacillus aurantiacus]
MSDFFLLSGVLLLAFTAWKTHSLTPGGAAASAIIGTVITFAFSMNGLLLLAGFFISSTWLGRYYSGKSKLKEEFEDKGEKRDASQVLANGGWAAAAALMFILTEQSYWIAAYIGSLAAANSDTWASSIGKSSRVKPVMVITRKPVLPGQSGGTSAKGTIGALAGSLFIVLLAYILFGLAGPFAAMWLIWPFLLLTGFISQWLDAFTGAFFQVLFKCDQCGTLTEKLYHCQQRTRTVKGWKWVTNDTVNHICTFSGMILGGVSGAIFYV